jgi:hypothetical protein
VGKKKEEYKPNSDVSHSDQRIRAEGTTTATTITDTDLALTTCWVLSQEVLHIKSHLITTYLVSH